MPERRFIEEKFPIKEISEKSKREMSARPPIVEMNFYWARRPLISCRASIIGSILSSRISTTKFREAIGLNVKNPYEFQPDQDIARGLKILDPFAGRGSIPFECLRAGAETYASDFNPLSYVILKCTLEYPIKYGTKIVEDVKKWGNWLIDNLRSAFGFLFPKSVDAYMWVWHIKCGSCNKISPILKNWAISPRKKIAYELSQNGLSLVKNSEQKIKANYVEGKAYCAYCNNTIEDTVIKRELGNFLNANGTTMTPRLSGVIVDTPKGKDYINPRNEDVELSLKAQKVLDDTWEELMNEDTIPIEEIAPYQSRGLPIVLYGYKYWYQLMNPRHLIYGSYLIRLIRKARKLIQDECRDEEYAKAVSSYLLMLLNKFVDFNNRSNIIDVTSGAIKHTMGFRGAIFTTDFYEPNPFVKSSGSLVIMLKDVLEGLEFCVKTLHGKPIPNIELSSALSLPYTNEYFDLIITDPPYENDVFYAELSDMLYVWMKRASEDYPDIFKYRTLWQELSHEEVSNNTQRFLSEKQRMKVAGNHYHKLMLASFTETNRLLKSDGILTVFFSHSSTKAWSRLVTVLMGAGFKIISSWPVHTEMSQRPTAKGKEVIDSSIIVVARKRDSNEVGYLERIRPLALARVRDFVNLILNEQPAISWADLVNAGMGPAMEVISSFKEIKSMKGDLSIDDVLNEISRVVTHIILERLLGGNVTIDPITAIYILLNTSRKSSRAESVTAEPKKFSYDYVSRLCLTLSVQLNQVKEYGVLTETTEKKKVAFQLITPVPNDMHLFLQQRKLSIDAPTSRNLCIIDVVHLMEYAFGVKGKSGLEQLARVIPSDLANSALEVMHALHNSLPPGDEERELIRPILAAELDPKKGQMDSYF